MLFLLLCLNKIISLSLSLSLFRAMYTNQYVHIVISVYSDMSSPCSLTLLFHAGGSAGGNLVAAVTYALSLPEERQLGHPPIYAQILISPLLQSIDFNTPSYQWNNSDVSEISREYMIRFW